MPLLPAQYLRYPNDFGLDLEDTSLSNNAQSSASAIINSQAIRLRFCYFTIQPGIFQDDFQPPSEADVSSTSANLDAHEPYGLLTNGVFGDASSQG